VLAVDPFSAWGLFGINTPSWLVANNTALVVTALLFLVEDSLKSDFHFLWGSHPRWIGTLTWLSILATFVVCNVVYSVTNSTGNVWPTGIFNLWLALLIAGVFTAFGVVTIRLTLSMADGDLQFAEERANILSSLQAVQRPSAAEVRQRKKRMHFKVAWVLALAIVVFIWQLTAGLRRLMRPEVRLSPINLDWWDPWQHALLFGQMLFLIVVLWVAWIPFYSFDPLALEAAEMEEQEEEEEEDQSQPQSWQETARKRVEQANRQRQTLEEAEP